MRSLFFHLFLIIVLHNANFGFAAATAFDIRKIAVPSEMLDEALSSDPLKTVVFLDLDKFLGYYTNPNCGGVVTSSVDKACSMRAGTPHRDAFTSIKHRLAWPKPLDELSEDSINYYMFTHMRSLIGGDFAVFEEAVLTKIGLMLEKGFTIKILTSRNERFQKAITEQHLKSSGLKGAGISIAHVIFCGTDEKYQIALGFLQNRDTQFVYFGDDDYSNVEGFAKNSGEFQDKKLFLYHLKNKHALCSQLCLDQAPNFDPTSIDSFVGYFASLLPTYGFYDVLPDKISAGMVRVFTCDGNKYVIKGLRFGKEAKSSVGGAKDELDITFADIITRELREEYFTQLPLLKHEVKKDALIAGGAPFHKWTRYVTFFVEERGYTKKELENALVHMNDNATLHFALATYFAGFKIGFIPEVASVQAEELLSRIAELEKNLAFIKPRDEVKNMLTLLRDNARALEESRFNNDGYDFAKEYIHDYSESSKFELMELSDYMRDSMERFSQQADDMTWSLFGS